MDSMKMYSLATKIRMKLAISRGMRADPLEGGGSGDTTVRPKGDGGWMRVRAVQQPYDYPSLWGIL